MEPRPMMTPTHNKGFAMLFTVLLVSLILTIAIGISNLTLRQTVLSNLAKDSGIAFYQADAAVECGMYQEMMGMFLYGSDVSEVPAAFECAGVEMILNPTNSYQDHFEYVQRSPRPNDPCFSILFDKTQAYLPAPYNKSRVLGSGKNICTQHPRQVERALEVKY